jgi:hypothetical protein
MARRVKRPVVYEMADSIQQSSDDILQVEEGSEILHVRRV